MSLKVFIYTSVNTVLFSNFFISLSAVALTLSSCLLLLTPTFQSISVSLVLFIFFSTLFIYNFYIYFSRFSGIDKTCRGRWVTDNRKFVKVIFILSALGLICTVGFLSKVQMIFMTHLGVLSLLYIIPVRIGKYSVSLKKIPLIKIVVLAYVWAFVTVVVPAQEIGKGIEEETFVVFAERFVFIFALAIPFDIRDRFKDKENNIITIPGLLGITGAKRLSVLLLVLFIFSSMYTHGLDYVAVSRILSGMAAIFFINKINDKASDFFYMLFIDGIMFFHSSMLLITYCLLAK